MRTCNEITLCWREGILLVKGHVTTSVLCFELHIQKLLINFIRDITLSSCAVPCGCTSFSTLRTAPSHCLSSPSQIMPYAALVEESYFWATSSVPCWSVLELLAGSLATIPCVTVSMDNSLAAFALFAHVMDLATQCLCTIIIQASRGSRETENCIAWYFVPGSEMLKEIVVLFGWQKTLKVRQLFSFNLFSFLCFILSVCFAKFD